jgi:hypothetical protein
MRLTPHSTGLAAASVLALALAGCGSSASKVAPAAAGPAASTTGPSAPPSMTPPAASTPPPRPALARTASPARTSGPASEAANLCRLAELSVTAAPEQGAAGTVGAPIQFRNAGHRTCQLVGYPGVAGLDSAGRQAIQAARVGSNGGPTVVTIAPGQVASALVTGSDVPRGNATSCPTYSLLVTPPGETHSIRVAARLPGCSGLAVRPVVAGTMGT